MDLAATFLDSRFCVQVDTQLPPAAFATEIAFLQPTRSYQLEKGLAGNETAPFRTLRWNG
jgi:hypothetical protein